jgi:hypothetical protein
VRRDSPPPRGLAELQRRFFELITGAESVTAELAARGVPASDAEDVARGLAVADARASAVERLDVYANMYFFRILDALRADYPKLLAVVGDEAFHDLATGYLLAHPSRHPSLRYVGAALPEFLAEHRLARERPWLGELAALEWARVDVFDRRDVEVMTREWLGRVEPEEFGGVRLVAVEACEVVRAAWRVEGVWRGIEDGDEDEDEDGYGDGVEMGGEGHGILVWRKGVTVFHRGVERDEARGLDMIERGTTFGELCATLAEVHGSDEVAAARAVQLLGGWLADELLAGGGRH